MEIFHLAICILMKKLNNYLVYQLKIRFAILYCHQNQNQNQIFSSIENGKIEDVLILWTLERVDQWCRW